MTSLKNEKGSYFPFIAFSCLAMAFGIGLMVDVGRIYVAKQRLQNAMDATLIGVGEKYVKDPAFFPNNAAIESALGASFKANLQSIELDVPDGSAKDVPCSQTIAQAVQRTEIEDKDAKHILAIDCDITVPTLIMNKLPTSLGMGTYKAGTHSNSTPIAHSAEFSIDTENGGGKPLVVVMVIDMSESVRNRLGDRIRPAAKEVLNALDSGDYLAVTTFNKGYNGGQRSATVGKWFTNVISTFHEVTPESKTIVEGLIDANIVDQNIIAGSYGQGGLYMGRKLIKALNGYTDRNWNDYRKVILFISDGQLTESVIPPDESTPPPVVTGPIISNEGNKVIDPFVNNALIKFTFPPRVILSSGPDPSDPWAIKNAVNKVTLPSNIDLRLGWTSTCGNAPWGFPMAAREADIARTEGIEVFSFCTNCNQGYNEAIMRRIAADQDLNNWEEYKQYNAEMDGAKDLNGDGDQDWFEYLRKAAHWKIFTETSDTCGGYNKNQIYDDCWVKKPTNASGANWACAKELPTHLVHRKRFYMTRFGVVGEELEDVIGDVIGDLKKQGRLSQ